MFNLTPRPAFQLEKGHFGRADVTGLTINEVSGLSIVALIAHKGQRAALSAEIKTRFGLDLPTSPRRVGHDSLSFVWAGPGQWLAIGTAPDLYDQLATHHAATIDQSGGRALLRLSGSKLHEVLRKGVTIDMHTDVFKPDDVALTGIAHISAALWRLDEQSCEIAIARSFTESFGHWLSVSAAEYGYEVG